MQQEHPGSSLGDISKMVGAAWKELDEAARQPYKVRAAEEKSRYAAAKEVYDATQP